MRLLTPSVSPAIESTQSLWAHKAHDKVARGETPGRVLYRFGVDQNRH